MAMLIPDGDDLVVRLSPLEKVGAVHGDVRVALGAVRDVDVAQHPFREIRGVRAPGTGVPGRIALSTWRYRGGKDFLALYRGKPAVMVHLRDAPFGRLVVCTDDADAVAATIRAAT